MEGLLGKSETSHDKSSFSGEGVGPDPFSSAHLFPPAAPSHSNSFYSNQVQAGSNNQNIRHNQFVSPSLSIPNPKRANPIDFAGLSDAHVGFSVPHSHTPQGHHDRFGSSFSHLSTETRSELSALGVSMSRAKSSDMPTPDIHDPLNLHQNNLPWQSKSALGFQSSNMLSEPDLDEIQQRILTPKPGSALGGITGSNPLNLSLNADNDNRNWPFVDKPPGLLSRATSSLGISSMVQSSNILNGLTRPVSTPAYLNKNNDALSSLGLGLGLGSLGFQSNQSGLLMSDQRTLHLDPLLQQSHRQDNNHFGGSTLGSELGNLGNPLGGFGGLSLEANEESRWPKPVRYARPMDAGDNILGSILRPPSSTDVRSPMSNTDRFSISPKPGVDRGPFESRMQSVSREITPPPNSARISPKLSMTNVDDRAIENVIATNCHHILLDAAEHSLKAVELANTLRARVGTEVLAIVRERWGGLLSLLERHPEKFLVERIPKNDRVSLYSAKHAQGLQPSSNNLESAKDELGDREDGEGITTDPQQASRCLHVGNVPASYTEVQLMREFEKFGQLDGLKLISQKNGNRRFAFVTYKTVAQAITARHCLSKVHPWKSAISFAHRDFSNNTNGSNNAAPGVGGNTMNNQNKGRGEDRGNQNPVPHSNHHHHNNNNGAPIMNKPSPQKASSQHHGLHQENSHHSFHNPMPNQHFHNRAHHPFQNAHFNGNGNEKQWDQSLQHHHEASLSGEAGLLSDQLSGKHSSYSGGLSMNQLPSSSLSYSHVASKTSQQQQQQHHAPVATKAEGGTGGGGGLIGTHPTIESFPDKNALQIILTRLCDDKYVPTQPWPIDAVADVPFCQAVIDQVSHFGGSTTISKLRGFLKHRVGTVDNIKSVPLKAMLLAYPALFRVEGNLVSLLNHPSNNVNNSDHSNAINSNSAI